MRWVGYAWLAAAGLFVVAAVIYASLLLHDLRVWAVAREEAQERPRLKHPSRPTGPEDEPRWKEWASE